MLPESVDSTAQVEALLRVLRRYADSGVGQKLAATFADLGEGEAAGLVAFEEGSNERIVESVLAAVHQKLALIVLDLQLEIGSTRLDAAKWAEDLSPDDFGGAP
jgi:hypothetical protein